MKKRILIVSHAMEIGVIELWLGRIGSEYILSQTIVVALIIRFFVERYMNMMSAFRSTLGLFTQGNIHR